MHLPPALGLWYPRVSFVSFGRKMELFGFDVHGKLFSTIVKTANDRLRPFSTNEALFQSRVFAHFVREICFPKINIECVKNTRLSYVAKLYCHQTIDVCLLLASDNYLI